MLFIALSFPGTEYKPQSPPEIFNPKTADYSAPIRLDVEPGYVGHGASCQCRQCLCLPDPGMFENWGQALRLLRTCAGIYSLVVAVGVGLVFAWRMWG